MKMLDEEIVRLCLQPVVLLYFESGASNPCFGSNMLKSSLIMLNPLILNPQLNQVSVPGSPSSQFSILHPGCCCSFSGKN